MATKTRLTEKLMIERSGKSWRVVRLTRVGKLIEIRQLLARTRSKLEAQAYVAKQEIKL